MTATRINSPTKLTRTLLWTNSSPSSAFSAQRVNISNLVSYDEIWVYAKGYVSYGNDSLHKCVTRTGSNKQLTWVGLDAPWAYIWARPMSVNNGSIDFGNAYSKSLTNTSLPSVENNRLIPYQVYGVSYS